MLGIDQLRRSTMIACAAALCATLSIEVVAADGRYLPDPATTPGALNSAVTQANIESTICRQGWELKIRPDESYTERLKRQQLYTPSSPYFAPGTRLRAWEEDHRVPLGLGGAPDDRRNLWPEPRFGTWDAERKDELEGLVHDLVCRGRLTLDQGRAAFLGDWTEAYERYFIEPQRSDALGIDHAASASARDQRDLLAAPLPSPAERPVIVAPSCASVWRPKVGPWVFKRCP